MGLNKARDGVNNNNQKPTKLNQKVTDQTFGIPTYLQLRTCVACICLCLQPDKAWHKVKSPKVD